MSVGWQRNEANSYLRLKPDYLSYSRYWSIYCQWIKKMRYALENDSTEEFAYWKRKWRKPYAET